MTRNLQARRQWRLWSLLCRAHSPRSAKELAAELAPDRVSARTVRRDLELLKELGVPIRVRRQGRDVRYHALGDGPEFLLNGETLLALRLSLGLLRPYEGTPVGDSLEQLVRSLEARLPARVAEHFAPLCESVTVRPPASSFASCEPAFAAVRRALQERRILSLDYRARDGARTARRVHPQGLLHGPRGLYLLALDESRGGALRTFRVERILSANVELDPAKRAPDLDPDRYLAGSLGVHSPEHEPRLFRIRIHDAIAARELEENPLHASQALEKDGGAWTLTLTLESSRELVPHVLAMGASAEVIEPRSFVQEIAGILRLAVARYERAATPGRARRSRSRYVQGAE